MIIADTDRCCNDCNSWSDSTGAERDARSAPGRTLAGVPLGIVIRNPSPEDPRGLQADVFPSDEAQDPHKLARANRWALKSVVNKLLPGSITSKCMVWRAPVVGHGLANIDLCKGQTHGKAFYQGLLSCGQLWPCPICAAKISERRRQELQEAMKRAKALGWKVFFVTLTIRHGIGDDIQELLDKQADALKRLSHGKYSVKNQLRDLYAQIGDTNPSEIHGYIRALEVTHGDNGFHPHFHILVFTDPNVIPHTLLHVYRDAWKRACRLSGLPEPSDEHGVTVEDGSKASDYVSKWGLEDEMTKAHAKTAKKDSLTPFGLLRAYLDGDDPRYPPERAGKLFQVYAAAFKGRRQLFWSVGLRKLLDVAPEVSDEVLVSLPEDERALLLATLTPEQWKVIRRRKQEANLLTVAESLPDLVPELLASLVDDSPGEPLPDNPVAPVAAASLPAPVLCDDATRDRLILEWVNIRHRYMKGIPYGKEAPPESSGVLLPPRADSGGSGFRPDRLPCDHESGGGSTERAQLGFSFDSSYALRRG